MIVDAFEDKADAFVLISGDADQSAPLSYCPSQVEESDGRVQSARRGVPRAPAFLDLL